MNRQDQLNYFRTLGLGPATYGEETIMFQTVEAIKEKHLCNSCRYDYCGCSVQDSILQIDPKATFETFGCNSFEPCK